MNIDIHPHMYIKTYPSVYSALASDMRTAMHVLALKSACVYTLPNRN